MPVNSVMACWSTHHSCHQISNHRHELEKSSDNALGEMRTPTARAKTAEAVRTRCLGGRLRPLASHGSAALR